ncbi:hypothetical protein AX16_002672 [Volvariella volvacea WC 439]|nr:hypothetical protein AX16_002672 [Volvariella volvacea WC 439]
MPSQAVKHPPSTPLQILAGPGSGKTKVLTSRIAYLILAHGIPPNAICAVTFTNKAATEMRERLTKLIGHEQTSALRMGTFHSLCAMFLRKHAKAVGLRPNFTICDADESKKHIGSFLKAYKELLKANEWNLREGDVASAISNAKAKGILAEDMLTAAKKKKVEADKANGQSDAQNGAPATESTSVDLIIARIYDQYEQLLKRNNTLDFDDLLIHGTDLFKRHNPAVNWCQHILVDEFQDTNAIQYELMAAFANRNHVSVVGDPDQSIYGWRSADPQNMARMQEDFPNMQHIYLEENYRSTGSILAASLAIVEQDKSRIKKSLYTSHPAGRLPCLTSFPNERDEAGFIAMEIRRVVAHMGGMLNYGDFAILLRYNALSRTVENALQKEGIPSRILGGVRFFERAEIKDVLAFLHVIDNPRYDPGVTRIINIPSRGIGDKSIAELAARAERTKLSLFEVIEAISKGDQPDIKPAIKGKIARFLETIQGLREEAQKGATPAELIRHVTERIGYAEHLMRTDPDFHDRWENVKELITFASEFNASEMALVLEGAEEDPEDSMSNTPLRLFLQTSMLSSEGDRPEKEAEAKGKVTITTCHAAKGLEWPVVMIPAVEKGTFPIYRSDDTEEERRLLYVACTRAQGFLYLSYVRQRKSAGETKTKELSDFIPRSLITDNDKPVFTKEFPLFSTKDVNDTAAVLRRSAPTEEETKRQISEWQAHS